MLNELIVLQRAWQRACRKLQRGCQVEFAKECLSTKEKKISLSVTLQILLIIGKKEKKKIAKGWQRLAGNCNEELPRFCKEN